MPAACRAQVCDLSSRRFLAVRLPDSVSGYRTTCSVRNDSAITNDMTLGINEGVRAAGLRIVSVPTRAASDASLVGYGRVVTSFADAAVDLVPWPVSGRRKLDAGTGLGGGVTSGPFKMRWRGDVLYADNHAVGGHYVTGWACAPEEASEERASGPRLRVLTHEANYHPDGGQIFFPRNGAPFVALLALPGDDVRPEDFVAFRFAGDVGVHINTGVWHQPVYPLWDEAEFDDKQGAVHACVSVDFPREFGCLLSVTLT
jgi:ureidoglycolate lyase/seryl-tRNA synthetase